MNNPKPTTMDHHDNVTLARTILTECETFFVAIGDTAKANDSGGFIFRQIKELAEIGQELSFDWSSQFDGMADDLNKHLPGVKNGN